jgi:hypothetical protein
MAGVLEHDMLYCNICATFKICITQCFKQVGTCAFFLDSYYKFYAYYKKLIIVLYLIDWIHFWFEKKLSKWAPCPGHSSQDFLHVSALVRAWGAHVCVRARSRVCLFAHLSASAWPVLHCILRCFSSIPSPWELEQELFPRDMAPVFGVIIVSLCIFDCSWLIRDFVPCVDDDNTICMVWWLLRF